MRSGSSHAFSTGRAQRAGKGRLALKVSSLVILAGAGLNVARATETVTYTYDTLGRVIAAQSAGTVNDGRAASYCYDAAGNRTVAKADASGVLASCPATPSPTPSPSPTIAISDASDFEGSNFLFTVSMSAASSASISVSYATAHGSAGASDYSAESGPVTFPAGTTVQTIVISTFLDGQAEFEETFTVNLSGPTGGATIADGQGVGTIYDDGGSQCGPVGCL